MVELTIDAPLRDAAPRLILGAITTEVSVTKFDAALWKEIEGNLGIFSRQFTLETLSHHPAVQALREAYRALGKDPARYRSSAESLGRRVLQGKGLYKVNTIVDINNLVSLQSLHSVGSYNLSALTQPLQFSVGQDGATYKGIGKDMINIAELPVFVDAVGPFGSPTSDSERAMITSTTTSLLMVIIAFDGDTKLDNHIEKTVSLLKRFASAANIGTAIIR
jgi:DNA/RNA-binding domain of Phe-tRNA-synthetase-like protein